jgi:hypothetical protein
VRHATSVTLTLRGHRQCPSQLEDYRLTDGEQEALARYCANGVADLPSGGQARLVEASPAAPAVRATSSMCFTNENVSEHAVDARFPDEQKSHEPRIKASGHLLLVLSESQLDVLEIAPVLMPAQRIARTRIEEGVGEIGSVCER